MSPNHREAISAVSSITGKDEYIYSTNHALNINATITPSGTQDVNITKVAGAAIAQGHGVAATAIRVELPTDGTGVVGLNAGTNVIGHVITDTGSTTAVTGSVSEQAGLSAGSLNADLVPSTDVGTYKWLGLQVLGTFSGTLSFQGSNDGTNFFTVGLNSAAVGASGGAAGNIFSASTTTGGFFGPVNFRYFRVRMTSYVSGTATGVLELYGTPATPLIPTTSSIQAGTWTVQPGNTANTTAWKVDGSAVTQPVSYATTGSGTSTGALRVELPTNGTGVIATVGAVTAITNALPAGTNGIGKLTANSGVTIGAVEIAAAQTLATVTTVSTVTNVATIGTSVTPGTAAANLGKAEDAVAGSGDTGVMVLGVRNDSLTAAQTSATGDYGAVSIDTSGILITAGAPRLLKGRQVTTITSSTSETTIVTAVASTFLDIYGLVLSNTSATATEVTVRDATAGGTISSFMVPAGDTRGFMLPLDSAVPQATVNNNWTATCGSSVASLKISALYVKRV